MFLIYCKIPLIRPGCIYGQRTNLMDLYLGNGGLKFGRKDTSICNLLNKLLFFLFSRICNNHQPKMVKITSHAATICPKSAKETSEQHCVKYTQIRAFSDLYFFCIWYRDRIISVFYHISYSYARKNRSEKAGISAYFTSCQL